jgi:hypothetical protein
LLRREICLLGLAVKEDCIRWILLVEEVVNDPDPGWSARQKIKSSRSSTVSSFSALRAKELVSTTVSIGMLAESLCGNAAVVSRKKELTGSPQPA